MGAKIGLVTEHLDIKKFEETLGKYCSSIEFGENVGSDIKMIVETTFTEPGSMSELCVKAHPSIS